MSASHADTIDAAQVNGKVRDRGQAATPPPPTYSPPPRRCPAAKYLEGVTLVKEVVVPGRLVSLG
jgi:hypothetical protein